MGSFFKNSLMTIITNIFLLFVGLFTSIIIARLLGPDKKGIYTIVLLLPSMIFTFLNFGINAGTVYFTGKKKFPLSTIIGNNLLIVIILGVISVIIGIGVIFFLGDTYFAEVPRNYLLVGLIIAPLTLFIQFFTAILQGKEDFKRFNLTIIINKLVFLVLIFILFLYPEVSTVLLAYICGLIASVFVLYLWLIKPQNNISIKLDRRYLNDLFNYGIKAYLANVIAFLNYRFDMILINFFLNPLAVGYYSVAVSISERIWLLSQSVSTVLLPRISSLESEEEKKNITALTSRVVVFITFIGTLLLYFLSDWLVPLLFSKAYVESIIPLKILLIGIFSLSFTKILANDLAGRGMPQYNMFTSMVALFTNIILNIYLIPIHGINGAAIATAISYSIQAIITILIYMKISCNSFNDIFIIKISDLKMINLILFKR